MWRTHGKEGLSWFRRFGLPTLRRRNRILFLSRHPVLDHLAEELAIGLSGALQLRHFPVLVYCGVHKTFGPAWRLPGFRIGLQTEQFMDLRGSPLFGARKPKLIRNLAAALARCDLLLDLNPSNAPFYDDFGLSAQQRQKLRFGPHIFPD